MKDFDILLINQKGLALKARVQFIYPDHFIVDIHHLKLTLKVLRNDKGKLECEHDHDLHSALANDICTQINKHLNSV